MAAVPSPQTKHRRLLAAVRQATKDQRSADHLGIDPVTALQEVLDGLVQDLRFTQSEVDALHDDEMWRDTLYGRLPNEWIRYRDDIRTRLEHVANNMVRNGIADRGVRVQEAQIALVGQALKAALEKSGISRGQQAEIGLSLREELTRLERTARLPEKVPA